MGYSVTNDNPYYSADKYDRSKFSLKNDKWIIEQAQKGMIEPFEPTLVSEIQLEDGRFRKVLSYGQSSYGVDVRLSSKEFLIFRHVPGTVINPKRFNSDNLESVTLQEDEDGEFFIIPAHSYGLGVALEKIIVPANITIICIGKSSYARSGLILNATPAEAKFRGHLTLEMSNSSSADCRVYANEGIAQLLFLEGEPCQTTYADRDGKYQDQPERVVMARI